MNILFDSAATKGNLVKVENEQGKQNVYLRAAIQ